jgi:hypothetical protein
MARRILILALGLLIGLVLVAAALVTVATAG